MANDKEVRARISVDTRDYKKGMEEASNVTKREGDKINKEVEKQGSTSEKNSNRVIQNNTKITGSYTKLKTATVDGFNKIKNAITSMADKNDDATDDVTNNSNRMVKAFTGIVSKIKAGADKIKASNSRITDSSNNTAGVWGRNLDEMIRDYENLVNRTIRANTRINGSSNQSTSLIRRNYDKLKRTLTEYGTKVKDTANRVISSSGRMTTTIRTMSSNQGRVIRQLGTNFGTLLTRVKNSFSGIIRATNQSVSNIRQGFNRIRTATVELTNKIKDGANRIKSSFGRIVSYVRTTAQNYRNSIRDMINDNEEFMNNQKDMADKVAETGKKIAGTSTAIATALGTAGYLAYSKAEDSTSKIQATLRLTKEEAEKLRETAKKLSHEGFDFDEALNGMLEVNKNLKDVLDPSQMEAYTRGALYLSKVFGVDVKDAVKASGAMMRNFGIDGAEALDIITWGFQNGLDMSGDFIDTLWEYAPQMKKLGFTAEETLQIINTGMKEGAFNTDKLLDGVKEFRLRLSEIDDTGAGALEKLGFNVETVQKAINAGGDSAKKMALKVSMAISKVKSDVDRNALSVALFGTQFEDVGDAIYEGLNNAKTPIEGLVTSAESLGEAYEDNVEMKMAGSINKLKDSFKGVGEAITPILVKVLDGLSAFLDWFSSLPEEVHKGIFIILGVVAVFGTLITVIASVIGAVLAVGVAIATFELWGPIVGIVTVLTGAIMGLLALDWGAFVEGAKQVGKFLLNLLETVLQFFVMIIGGALYYILTAIVVIGDYIGQAFTLVCKIFENYWDVLVEVGKGYLEILKSAFLNYFEAIKEDLRLTFEFFKALFSGDLGRCSEIVGEKFNNMVKLIKNTFSDAFKAVKDTIDRVKNLLNFEWKFPDIKVPKFNWSGGFDFLKGQTPKLNVTWHAKGGIYTKPTLFNTGNGVHGVGEAGAEAILPLDKLPDLLGLDKKGNGDMIFNFHDTQISGYQDVEQLSKELAVLVRRRTV